MPFADELLGSPAVEELAEVLARVTPGRAWPSVRRAAAELAELGLSDRARAVRDALLADAPAGYMAFQAVIRAALQDAALTGWMIWPVTEAVATLAVSSPSPDDFDDGLALLAELTPRLTAEFALRTFLVADLDRTLRAARGWAADPDEHVRRLASEGTRQRLPWARRVPALTARPEATVSLLDLLYRDESDYVRRSVANHLNDLSRADGELAVRTAAAWVASPDPADPADPAHAADPAQSARTARLVRHALRTLIKQGHPGALALLGYTAPTGLVITGPTLHASLVNLGGELTFGLTVANPGPDPVRVAIDYVVHYRKANATLAPKVFKLTTRTLAAGESVDVVRRHSFAPITTRRHYPGEHAVELQVNGAGFGRVGFEVIDPG